MPKGVWNDPLQLTEEYLFAHDLREASQKTYRAATRALMKHFGSTVTVQEITHRSVLEWRRKVLEQGLSKRSWNTYSSHLRTVWGYAIEYELLTHSQINPFKKTEDAAKAAEQDSSTRCHTKRSLLAESAR